MKDPWLPATANTSFDFLADGREMAKLILAKDWSLTPLGPMERWPQSLRTTVGLCVASNFPISIAWGPQRVQIYNDDYWPLCAAKHPHSLGQDFKECWLSAWPVIGETFERAQRGETSHLENQRMFLDRNGFLEETFFTFSFSPIRNETGQVAGLFHPVMETTPRILAERRTRVLRELAAGSAHAKTVEAACAAIFEVLADCVWDVPFALLYLNEDGPTTLRLAGSLGLPAGAAANWPLPANPEAALVQDIRFRMEGLPCGPYPEAPNQVLVLPIPGLDSSRRAGVLVAGVSARLRLDDAYRAFYELLTNQVGTSLAAARTHQEDRRRAEVLSHVDARLRIAQEKSQEDYRLLAARLETIREEDRARIARELHDELGQSLTGIRIDLTAAHRYIEKSQLDAALAKISEASAAAGSAIQLTRRIATDLRPVILDQLGLVEAIDFYAKEFGTRSGIEVHVHTPAVELPVDSARSIALYRIAQESLTNVARHAKASVVNIGLHRSGPALILKITDNGVGFLRPASGAGSLGLLGMEERARTAGGALSVESTPGAGTTVTVTVPLDRPG